MPPNHGIQNQVYRSTSIFPRANIIAVMIGNASFLLHHDGECFFFSFHSREADLIWKYSPSSSCLLWHIWAHVYGKVKENESITWYVKSLSSYRWSSEENRNWECLCLLRLCLSTSFHLLTIALEFQVLSLMASSRWLYLKVTLIHVMCIFSISNSFNLIVIF